MLEVMGSEHASDPCRRHGQKLVSFYTTQTPEKGAWENVTKTVGLNHNDPKRIVARKGNRADKYIYVSIGQQMPPNVANSWHRLRPVAERQNGKRWLKAEKGNGG